MALVAESEGWSLRVHFEDPHAPVRWRDFSSERDETAVTLRGDAALRVAAQLLPAINSAGANRADVGEAVRMIGDAADPTALFKRHATIGSFLKSVRRRDIADREGRLVASLPKQVRLALEMATHEESERRALEGELALLEAAWQSAEEIAAIADDMLVSDETRARLAELKRGDDARDS
jgi:hypothetical protein